MKQWILEKQGQLKLFSCLFILILISTHISWANKIVITKDKNGNEIQTVYPDTIQQTFSVIQTQSRYASETLHYYTKNQLNIKFIPITINNIPLDAMIDTGASYVSLNTDSIRQLNIKTFMEEVTINTTNGITKGYLFTTNSIKVGNIELNNIKCIYQPTLKENLLGGSFLSNFNYFFNEQEQTISLIPKKENPQTNSSPLSERIKQITEAQKNQTEQIPTTTVETLPTVQIPVPEIIETKEKPPQSQTSTMPKPTLNPENAIATVCAGLTLCGLFSILLPIIFLTVWIISLIDIVKNEFTGSNKIIWVLVISFVPLIGSILYWTMGEKQKIHVEKSTDSSTSEKRKYNTPKL